MPMTPSSTADRRPTVDEWGVYDPQQAGLAALYTKLTTPGGNQEPTETEPPCSEQAPTVKPSDR